MKAHSFFNLNEIGWREFGGIAKGVFVKDISTKAFADEFNTSLFRVEPDGEFPIHKHAHAHVFYFLSGEGKCWIGTKSYKIQPGYVALIPGGEEHGYKNTGKIPILFVVLNSPATR